MEWKSEQINELATALAKAQATIKNAKKSGSNPHFGSDYSELSDLWDACRIPLSSNGLSVTQFSKLVGNQTILHSVLLHSSGQWIMGEYELAPEKRSPQGFGSALSYARRYCLAALLGIASEDDDAEGAMVRHNTKTPPPKHPPVVQTNPVTPDSSWSELADYRVPFGKKYVGKRLGDVPLEELKDFLSWLETQPELSKAGREFLLIGLSFYEQATARDMVGNGNG